MSRWKAAGIHLLLSLGVFLLALLLILKLWYPHPYWEAAGGQGLLVILSGVDITLGPLITLIIFKAGKKGLKLDLTLIGLAQLAALSYGMYVVAQARPAFVVFALDRFQVVQASEVVFEGATNERYAGAPWTGPVVTAARRPSDPKEREKILFSALGGGPDLDRLARLYQDYESLAERAVAKAKPLAVLAARFPEQKGMIGDFLERHGLRENEAVYLPLVALKQDMAMVLHKSDGRIVGALPLDPW
ncbi:MAG: hypothetical protein HYV16_14510 [Gammaproteobacteria bacterium]|nr:hypothetical protein [Gammaproteobacteria bacterium]